MHYINNNYDFQRCLWSIQEGRDPEKTDLYREKAFNLLLSALFEKCAPISGTEEIIVTGYVMADGKGDWFNMLNTCKHLQKKFPDRNIRIIAGAAIKHRDGLPHDKIEDCHLVFAGTEMEAPNLTFDRFEEGEELVLRVKEAAAVVIGPIELPGLYHPFSVQMLKKGIAVQEYDISTNFDSLCDRQLLMGLHPLDGMGIFTRALKDYSFKDVENLRLRKLLFQDPFSFDPEDYLSTHQFFLCYMGEKAACRFLEKAVAFAFALHPDQDVDICYPCKDSKENLLNWIRQINWNGKAIGSIQFLYYDGDELKSEKMQIEEGGRKLRIIDVGLLSPRDFRVLTRISAPMIGCTGDNSLATALSYGKLPFYEIAEHKVDFAKNVEKLVMKQFGDHSPLFRFLKSWAFDPASSERLIHEAEAFGRTIREHYSVNGRMQGIVNERILYAKDPEYAHWIEGLLGEYLDEAISIEAVAEELEMELMQRGLLDDLNEEGEDDDF